MDGRQANAWISDARFGRFLDAAGGDQEQATALYAWHARISAASHELVHHFEVLVRNTIDHVLGNGQPQHPLKDTWLMDFDVLQPDGIKQVIVAVERLEKGKQITRGRVIAGVSFGFWAGLFANSRHYEELWRHQLRNAFPHGSVTRKDLIQPMRQIQRFRNRVAHHDSLLDQDIGQRTEDMLRIAGWIDPDAKLWIEGRSQVAALLQARPTQPAL